MEQETKTFTQEELDKVVSDRLKREREKFADYDELKSKADKYAALEESNKLALEKSASLETELNAMKKAESVRNIREEVSKASGVPSSLLTAETLEECTAQAQAIAAFAKPKYPETKDGGEVSKPKAASTKEQFAEWAAKTFN